MSSGIRVVSTYKYIQRDEEIKCEHILNTVYDDRLMLFFR